MTEYVIAEVGRHQWLVFADRQSIAFCASENEAVEVMTEHSVRNSRLRAAIWFGRDAARAPKDDGEPWCPGDCRVAFDTPA